MSDYVVIYDQVSGVVLRTLVDATETKLARNERMVKIPRTYAMNFASFNDCLRTIPQLAAGFDES